MAKFISKLLGIEEREEKEEKPREWQEPKSFKNPVRGPLKITINAPTANVERYYFWIIRFLEKIGAFGRGYSGDKGYILKIKDVYTSAETSSYWGNVEQRKGAQQDRISQYLANIGKFIKDLFQIVRELRILDERLGYYDGIRKGEKPADIALKGIWIDIVEGGGKNPSSVYGLAAQVGFVTLPDLFFDTFVKPGDSVEKAVSGYESKGINRKVREVLARKLEQYALWRDNTERELRQRRKFVLLYLVQEFNVIKMYATWLKPYLENVKKLQQHADPASYDIATAFDTAKIELEVLAVRKQYEIMTYYGNKEERDYVKNFPVLRVRIKHVTIPQMAYQQEYQRGAIHTGHTEITIDGLVASKEDLEAYKRRSDYDTFEVLAAVDQTVEALRDDLEKYLKDAVESYKLESVKGLFPFQEKKEEKGSQSIFEPFKALLSGFAEIGKVPFSWKAKEEKEEAGDVKITRKQEEEEKKAASDSINAEVFLVYDVFKKAHKMFTP